MVVDRSNEGQGAPRAPSVLLCSGGVDSAVLLAFEAESGDVQPVYVESGLAWEPSEQAVLRRLLASPLIARRAHAVRPLATLRCPMDDLYSAAHWAVRGAPPAYHTPDADVYLPGRNVLLLAKAAVYCALQGFGRIVVGPLAGNPFPDATPEFFAAMAGAVSTGLDDPIAIAAPFASRSKADVIRLGAELGVPWSLTVSCMRPAEDLHCGRCSKCRERVQAFAAAGVADAAVYAHRRVDAATG